MWRNGLSIWSCYCSILDCCWGTDSILGLGTSTYHECGKKKRENILSGWSRPDQRSPLNLDLEVRDRVFRDWKHEEDLTHWCWLDYEVV